MTKRDRMLHELIVELRQIELTLHDFCRDPPDWWNETIKNTLLFLEDSFDEEDDGKPRHSKSLAIIHSMPPSKQ